MGPPFLWAFTAEDLATSLCLGTVQKASPCTRTHTSALGHQEQIPHLVCASDGGDVLDNRERDTSCQLPDQGLRLLFWRKFHGNTHQGKKVDLQPSVVMSLFPTDSYGQQGLQRQCCFAKADAGTGDTPQGKRLNDPGRIYCTLQRVPQVYQPGPREEKQKHLEAAGSFQHVAVRASKLVWLPPQLI